MRAAALVRRPGVWGRDRMVQFLRSRRPRFTADTRACRSPGQRWDAARHQVVTREDVLNGLGRQKHAGRHRGEPMANAFSPGVEGNAKGVRVAAGLGRSAPGEDGSVW